MGLKTEKGSTFTVKETNTKGLGLQTKRMGEELTSIKAMETSMKVSGATILKTE